MVNRLTRGTLDAARLSNLLQSCSNHVLSTDAVNFTPPRGLVGRLWVPDWDHPVGRLFGNVSMGMALVVIVLFLLLLAVALEPAFVHFFSALQSWPPVLDATHWHALGSHTR